MTYSILFCSNLLLSGAHIKDVKEMIGPIDISMTDRYSHLILNHYKAIQDKLAKHYENTTS
jgi:site-specific recombinase XerD